MQQQPSVPKSPEVPPPPPPIEQPDAADILRKKRNRQEAARRVNRGRSSTILAESYDNPDNKETF
jgi:hypothetical protein